MSSSDSSSGSSTLAGAAAAAGAAEAAAGAATWKRKYNPIFWATYFYLQKHNSEGADSHFEHNESQSSVQNDFSTLRYYLARNKPKTKVTQGSVGKNSTLPKITA
jgi:hypothetical protein